MKSDFLLAITQLSAEKNLPKEVVISAVETALVSAYKKDSFSPNQNIAAKINLNTGKVTVWAEKTVVEDVADSKREVSLAEARKIKSDVQIGENIMVEDTPSNAGRIAAQTCKQVILQRLHEAEHSAILQEYAEKQGDIVTGVVQRIEPKQTIIDIGRTEAILPANEQVPNERHRPGQRVKVYLLEVGRSGKGPRVLVSRSHPELLRRLLEMEIPEIYNSVVELKAVAREAGFRSKIAVAARQEGIDPVGCCVGLRGIRIQNIVNELGGEKIDVVAWSPDDAQFIANALSPAHVLSVDLNRDDKASVVVVPDKQLSLAIGKEGQNVRLAAKLTGWRIDIKSSSVAEAEKAELEKIAAETRAEEAIAEAEKPGAEVAKTEETAAPAAETEVAPVVAQAEAPAAEKAPAVEDIVVPPEAVAPPAGKTVVKPAVRFAEDILGAPAETAASKAKKKKKPSKGTKRDEATEGGKRRKQLELEITVKDMTDEDY